MQQVGSFGRRGASPPISAWPAPAAVALTPAAPAPAEPAPGASIFAGLPVATAILALLLAVVFLLEAGAALAPMSNGELGPRTLTALGGVNGRLVFENGQAWRLFTAPWLHAGAAHLGGNLLVLALIGWSLERLVGGAWLAALYVLSALGGALASVLLNPAGPVSVGASGAIMGLLGAAFTCSFHAAAFDRAKQLRGLGLRFLVPALIPTSGHVDYSAHFGGAVTGAAIGLVLHAFWPEMDDRPKLARPALGIAAVAMVLALVGAGFAAAGRPAYVAHEAELMPDAELQGAGPDLATRSAALAARYPKDPRARLILASAQLDAGGYPAAEAEFRAGLSPQNGLDPELSAQLRPAFVAGLAATLKAEGRWAEAREAALPICRTDERRHKLMTRVCAELGL